MSDVHFVGLAEFEKLVRAGGGRDNLESHKKPFRFRGALFYPGLVAAYAITAAELQPLESYRGKTFTDSFGSFARPGFVKKLGGKKYVFAAFHQFVLAGTQLARSLEAPLETATGGSRESRYDPEQAGHVGPQVELFGSF